MELCPCGSTLQLTACCKPYISGEKYAPTAEALMRSRYTAYVLHAIDYLVETTHPNERHHYPKKELLSWAKTCHWKRLQIVHTTTHEVAFSAYYADKKNQLHEHREWSTFVNEDGRWYYLEGRDF